MNQWLKTRLEGSLFVFFQLNSCPQAGDLVLWQHYGIPSHWSSGSLTGEPRCEPQSGENCVRLLWDLRAHISDLDMIQAASSFQSPHVGIPCPWASSWGSLPTSPSFDSLCPLVLVMTHASISHMVQKEDLPLWADPHRKYPWILP